MTSVQTPVARPRPSADALAHFEDVLRKRALTAAQNGLGPAFQLSSMAVPAVIEGGNERNVIIHAG